MKVEIDFESVHKLSLGDCIEISGIVGEKKLEIIFLIASEATFRCCLDHKFGWDIYIIDKTVRDIHSGTIFSSLEYYPRKQFTINFKILEQGISTTLNDKELCSEKQTTSISDITSIQIVGDSALRHILFSDYSTKSSRVLQPLIYQSLDSNTDGKCQSVTVIESRQRIIFKPGIDEVDDQFMLEHDSDSEDDFLESGDMHREFDYLKKVLQSNQNPESDDFSPHYPNDVTPNKYIISYFDPDFIDSELKHTHTDTTKSPSKFQFYEVVKENMSESTSRLSILRSNTERIERSIANTGKDIEEIRHPRQQDVARPMKTKMLSIPISEMDGSYYKYDLTRGISMASKIPVLKSPKIGKEKVTNSFQNEKMAPSRNPKSPTKVLVDRKQAQSYRKRQGYIPKK